MKCPSSSGRVGPVGSGVLQDATWRRALQGTAEQIVGDLRQFKALGVSHVLMEARYRALDDMVEIFRTFARDIRPQVAD